MRFKAFTLAHSLYFRYWLQFSSNTKTIMVESKGYEHECWFEAPIKYGLYKKIFFKIIIILFSRSGNNVVGIIYSWSVNICPLDALGPEFLTLIVEALRQHVGTSRRERNESVHNCLIKNHSAWIDTQCRRGQFLYKKKRNPSKTVIFQWLKCSNPKFGQVFRERRQYKLLL